MAGSPRVVVIFRNDDPSGASDAAHEDRIASIFASKGIPQTHGVIPLCVADSWHDPSGRDYTPLEANPRMVTLLKDLSGAGSEIALHGYTHRTNRRSLPRRREYFEFKRLSVDEAEVRIRHALDMVDTVLRVRPETFIPPWNRIDARSVEGCARGGIRILSAGPFAPVTGRLVNLGVDCTVDEVPTRIEAAARAGRPIFIRVLYHSRTTRTPEEIAALARAVNAVAALPDCEAMTIREAVRRYPDAIRLLNEAARNTVPQDEVAGSARARVAIYRKLRSPLSAARALEREHHAAETDCRTGDYERAASRTAAIDRLSRRLLRQTRLALAAVALITAALVAALLSPVLPPVTLYAGGALFALLAGVGGWWSGTSPDTRDEMRTAALIAIAAGAAGIVLKELAVSGVFRR